VQVVVWLVVVRRMEVKLTWNSVSGGSDSGRVRLLLVVVVEV